MAKQKVKVRGYVRRDGTRVSRYTADRSKSNGEERLEGDSSGLQYRVDADSGRRFREGIRRTVAEREFGWAVDVKSEEFYSDPENTLFLSEDGLTGAVVTADGDAQSGFRHPEGATPMKDVLEEVFTITETADCYSTNGVLPNLYGQFGMRPAARLKFNPEFVNEGWDESKHGTPHIVFLLMDKEGASGLPEVDPENGVTYGSVMLDVPLVEDWDEAVAIREAAKKKRDQGEITDVEVSEDHLTGAMRAATTAFLSGDAVLNLHEGMLGVWADNGEINFFVPLAVADRAEMPASSDPEDHFFMWAKPSAHRPHVQVRVCSKSNKIVNWEDVSEAFESPEDEEWDKMRAKAEEEVADEIGQLDPDSGAEVAAAEHLSRVVVVEASEYKAYEVLGLDGKLVNLSIHPATGHVRDWPTKSPLVFMEEPSESEVALASRYTRVKPHSKRDGTRVSGYKQKRKRGTPAAPKKRGAEFIGFVEHVGFEPDRVRGGKGRLVSPPPYWAVYRFNSAPANKRYGLFRPESGRPAPPGVVTSWVRGADDMGGVRKGFIQQGTGFAQIENDEKKVDEKKLDELQSMVYAQSDLERSVDQAFNEEGLTRNKVIALIATLMNRHLFRIGSKVSRSKNSEGELIETYGITQLLPRHIEVSQDDTVSFTFPGKRGVEWMRTESGPRVVAIIKKLLQNTPLGVPVFQYEAEGTMIPVTDTDVRRWLSGFGFSPHNFRHYYANLMYTAFVKKRRNMGKYKTDKDALHEAALDHVSEKLGTAAATVERSYIVKSLADAVLENKEQDIILQPLELSEQYYPDWWEIEYEKDFADLIHALSRLRYQEMEAAIQNVSLSEVSLKEGGAPPKTLQSGDRWVTLKPHGPDSEDYRRVLIRQQSDGSAVVVWSGGGSLNHLRLNKVGTKSQVEKAEKRKARKFTPEERAAEAEKKQARKEMGAKNDEQFATEMVKALGLGGVVKPEEFLSAYKSKYIPKPHEVKSDEEREAARIKREKLAQEKIDSLLETGELPDGQKISDPATLEDALAEELLYDLAGMPPKRISPEGVAPELLAAWKKVRSRKDPDLTLKINATINEYSKRKSQIRRETRRNSSVKVVGTMGWYSDPEKAELDLLKSVKEAQGAKLRSKFYEKIDALNATKKVHATGAKDGLAFALQHFGATGLALNTNVIDLFGSEVVAETVSAHIRSLGADVHADALKRMEADFVKRELPAVEEAMAHAESLAEERIQIAHEAERGTIMQTVASRALAETTISTKKHLVRVAGSLQSMQMVMDSLRQKKPRPINISTGEGRRDALVDRMEGIGMNEGEHFHYVNEGGDTLINVPHEHAHMLLKTIGLNTKLDSDRGEIKSHRSVTGEMDVPGMADTIHRGGKDILLRLFPVQEAAVQFFEHGKRILGNLGVGLGKTITFGAMAARRFADGASHGFYFVPARLELESLSGLREAFPDMNIITTSGMSPAERKKLYEDVPPQTLILVSSDKVRQDAQSLAKHFDEKKPDFLLGDEVHELFSPTKSEKAEHQSLRSQALRKLTAPHMAVMTGTPFRQSLSEVWKVVDWLNPGSLGAHNSFMNRFAKNGQGTSAYTEAQDAALREALDPYVITEKDPPETKLKRNREDVDLSEAQSAELQDAYRAHYGRIHAGENRSKSSATLNAKVHKIVMSGGAEDNPLVKRAVDIINSHGPDGDHPEKGRSVIHAHYRKSVDSIVEAFPQGVILKMTGDTSALQRERIKNSINHGMVIEGARVKVGDFEGVVTKVEWDGQGERITRANPGVPVSFRMKGSRRKFKPEDAQLMVRGLAGTSVIGTGLNLQKGSNNTIHLVQPTHAADLEQKDGRNYRRGQVRDVHTYQLMPNTPHGRKKRRKLDEQKETMKGVDDPIEYNDPAFLDSLLSRREEGFASEVEGEAA
jgi:DNA topoisomerase IB/superfamily II DNA or RNA helicase